MSENAEPARRQKRGNQLNSMQVMFAAILAVGLLLAINFSSRIAASQPLQEAYNRVQTEIEQLRREQAALVTERDFVQSDAFVQRWARDDGKMVREGEVLVVPVPAVNSLVQPQSTNADSVLVETTPPKPQAWNVWWALFFDTPAPNLKQGS